jgi:hypothetical protein
MRILYFYQNCLVAGKRILKSILFPATFSSLEHPLVSPASRLINVQDAISTKSSLNKTQWD